MEEAKKLLPGVVWCADAYEAMQDADAVVIITEWNEFRSLDLERTKSIMKQPIMVDLRNVYTPEDMAAAGFIYNSIGRPPIPVRPAPPVNTVSPAGGRRPAG